MIDTRRDYRICAFHLEAHDGVHVHHPLDGPALGPVPVRSPVQAERLMRWYARDHEAFEEGAFKEVARAWRSESRKS